MTFTKINADGRGAKMGLMKGDVLMKCNGEELESLRDIFRIARDGGEVLTFTVKRGDKMVDAKMRTDDLRRR